MFTNPETKEIYKEGETYKRPLLARTLRKIAANGAKEMYFGETGKNMVKDIREEGGIITEEDLKQYK